jgi:hypothetical protein
MKWMTKEALSREIGLTQYAIEHYRYRGHWVEGVRWKRKERPIRIWFNYDEVMKWVASNETEASALGAKQSTSGSDSAAFNAKKSLDGSRPRRTRRI